MTSNAPKQVKHTPAPWSVGYTNPKDYGGGIIHFYSPVHVGTGTTKGNVIATVGMGGDGATDASAAAVKANAHLIAAAPDMLEAVRELLATHPAAYRDANKIDNRTDNAVRIARAAIAKAMGVE